MDGRVREDGRDGGAVPRLPGDAAARAGRGGADGVRDPGGEAGQGVVRRHGGQGGAADRRRVAPGRAAGVVPAVHRQLRHGARPDGARDGRAHPVRLHARRAGAPGRRGRHGRLRQRAGRRHAAGSPERGGQGPDHGRV